MNSKSKLLQSFPLLLGVLFIIFGMLPWAIVAGAFVGPFYPLMAFPALFLMMWLAVTVHEFGHFFAALAMKLHVHQFAIKPLQVIREGRAFRLRFFQSPNDGQVMAYPLDANRIRQRMIIFVAGGPLANWLVCLLCLVPAICIEVYFPRPLPRNIDLPFLALLPRNPVSYWLEFAGLMNLAYFLATLVPGRSANWPSDGSQLLTYFWNGARGELSVLVFTLSTIMLGGTRPSAWNAGMVERMLALRDGSLHDLGANLFGYYHAIDTKQWDRAGDCLDRTVLACNITTPKHRAAILLEKACFEAFHRQNVNARSWLAQVNHSGVENHTQWRAEAAVLFVEGHYIEAIAKAEAALAEVPYSVDRGGSIAEAEWLQEILAECRLRLIPKNDRCPVTTIGSEPRMEVT